MRKQVRSFPCYGENVSGAPDTSDQNAMSHNFTLKYLFLIVWEWILNKLFIRTKNRLRHPNRRMNDV